MLIHKFSFFPLLLSIPTAAAVPTSPPHQGPFKPPDRQHVLAPLHHPSPSPFPCTHHHKRGIQGFIALGDSYSAGIGTRPDPSIRESACRQGRGAYPYLLASDLLLPSNSSNSSNSSSSSSSSFQWLSCTGSTTNDILSSLPPPSTSQIDAINVSLPVSFATLTIGGNDLDFFAVLNACVFRFYGPWYGPSCEEALARAEEMFTPGSDSYNKLELRIRLILTEILDKVRWDRQPRFWVTVTGYARFFNEETKLCDGISLGVWLGGGGGWMGTGEKLTRDVRRRMNGLVEKANGLLERVVREVDAGFALAEEEDFHDDKRRRKVVYVDYDSAFTGHRLCEEGVKEPDYKRQDTWFFLPGGVDVDQAGRTFSNEDAVVEEDDPLVDPDVCLEKAETGGDWGERALCYMARAKRGDPRLQPGSERVLAPGDSMWFTPTYYGKTFHPRSAGHETIRDMIYQVWEEHGLLDRWA